LLFPGSPTRAGTQLDRTTAQNAQSWVAHARRDAALNVRISDIDLVGRPRAQGRNTRSIPEILGLKGSPSRTGTPPSGPASPE